MWANEQTNILEGYHDCTNFWIIFLQDGVKNTTEMILTQLVYFCSNIFFYLF